MCAPPSDVFDVRAPAERGAYNQARFREVNERIHALAVDPKVTTEFGTIEVDPEWVCECANVGCMERLTSSLAGYNTARAAAARFLVLASDSHVFGDIEVVVDRQPGYWVVEKTGRAKVVAEELYTRWRVQGSPH